jgi:hypothetical protein
VLQELILRFCGEYSMCRNKNAALNFLRTACLLMVPRAGIEPARLAARDFESRASTYSAISATQAEHYARFADFDQDSFGDLNRL